MERAYNDCVGGQPGANISYGTGGVMALGSKALVSVDNISGRRGGGWENFVRLKRLLGKVDRNLGV